MVVESERVYVLSLHQCPAQLCLMPDVVKAEGFIPDRGAPAAYVCSCLLLYAPRYCVGFVQDRQSRFSKVTLSFFFSVTCA